MLDKISLICALFLVVREYSRSNYDMFVMWLLVASLLLRLIIKGS